MAYSAYGRHEGMIRSDKAEAALGDLVDALLAEVFLITLAWLEQCRAIRGSKV